MRSMTLLSLFLQLVTVKRIFMTPYNNKPGHEEVRDLSYLQPVVEDCLAEVVVAVTQQCRIEALDVDSTL